MDPVDSQRATDPAFFSELDEVIAREQDSALDAKGLGRALPSHDKRAKTAIGRSLPKRNLRLSLLFSRTLARMVDLLWQIALVWLMVRTIFPIGEMTLLSRALIVGLALLPLALFLDALVQGVFGNTPGKKLLGIQAVTWRGRQLSIVESLERNFLVWRFGFLFGIVPLVPFSALRQWQLVLKGDRTHYDEQLHLRTKGYQRPIWLSVLAAAAAVTVLTLPVSRLVLGDPFFMAAGTEWLDRVNREQSSAPRQLSSIFISPLRRENPLEVLSKSASLDMDSGTDNGTMHTSAPWSMENVRTTQIAGPVGNTLGSSISVSGAGSQLFQIQAPFALKSLDPVVLPQLRVAPAVSTLVRTDVAALASSTRLWTNPYTGLISEIDATWELRDAAADPTIVFQNSGSESVLVLSRVASLAGVSLKGLAAEFIAEQPDGNIVTQQREIRVADFTGQLVVTESSEYAGQMHSSEWVRFDDVVYRLEVRSQPQTYRLTERLKAIIWSTFI